MIRIMVMANLIIFSLVVLLAIIQNRKNIVLDLYVILNLLVAVYLLW